MSSAEVVENEGVMGMLESLPIDWRILVLLLVVVVLAIFAKKNAVWPFNGNPLVNQP